MLAYNSLATQPASAADAFFAPDNSSHTDTTSFIDLTSLDFGEEFDANYGLLTPEQTVVVRAYSDDSDDLILAELQPRFIVMFEPNQDFVRRVEVCLFCLFLFGMWEFYFMVDTIGIGVS